MKKGREKETGARGRNELREAGRQALEEKKQQYREEHARSRQKWSKTPPTESGYAGKSQPGR